jgi:hypothetical protein
VTGYTQKVEYPAQLPFLSLPAGVGNPRLKYPRSCSMSHTYHKRKESGNMVILRIDPVMSKAAKS